MRALAGRIQCPPGRVALLMEEEEVPYLLLPSAVKERLTYFERPPFHLAIGTVVASGVSELPVGSRVWAMPAEGLWMRKKDLPFIPEGREVRFYGAGIDGDGSRVDWRNQILGLVKS